MHDPAIFAARRAALADALGPRAVAVIRSLPARPRNGDSFYPFRQASDLLYLTGFAEPEATLILRPGADRDRVVLFVRPRDPEQELWEGRRAGLEGARERYGADAAYPSHELPSRLADLIANFDELHYALGLDDDADRLIGAALVRLRKLEKRGQRPPRAVIDPAVALHELRLHKRPEELAVLRRAAAITAEAHVAAMAAGRPGASEHELAALLDYTFRRRGGSGPGYASIVGAGVNATVLHYTECAAPIADGELVLVDAGCELAGYTADVTRTWPASSRFSPAQRDVYQAVLGAQAAALALARPGATINDLHDAAVRHLTQAMIDLGLLAGTVDDRIADKAFRAHYMHGTSHWLGLDVHDAGAYTQGGKPRPLAPGMVITIEPGLYVAADAQAAPAPLRGIGVRIEDDVLITETGCEVLTAACPKAVDDVERACAR